MSKRARDPIDIEDVIEPFFRKNSMTLADKNPDVAAEWLYAKNCGFGPEHFSYGSNVRAWFECPFCVRPYKTKISTRTAPQHLSGCPYCASKRVCRDNSLADLFSDIAKEFHPSKNKLKASEVMSASQRKFWWRCHLCSHEWQATPSDRTIKRSGCPSCYEARLQICRDNPPERKRNQIELNNQGVPVSRAWYELGRIKFTPLLKTHPKVARQWHPNKNGDLKAVDFTAGSEALVWWKCPKGVDHEWQSRICSRTRYENSTCPFCTGHRVSRTNNLARKYPLLAQEWHPIKNGDLKPDEIVATSKHKAWWQCMNNSQHEWMAEIYRRINGTKCPRCAEIRPENSLAVKCPWIASQMHPTKNGTLRSTDITCASSQKIWWICTTNSNHEWEARPANRVQRGSGCPYCSGTRVSEKNSLAALYPHLIEQFDTAKNGGLTSDDVSATSKKPVWWICRQGHSWLQPIHKRTQTKRPCYECMTGKPRPNKN